MRILVIGDLHGRKPRIPTKNFDCMVVVGDVCDDRGIAPLYNAWFGELKKNPELDFEELAAKKLRSKKRLGVLEKRSLKRGAEIMKYLDSFEKPIFMVAGNWDQSYGKDKIGKTNKNKYLSSINRYNSRLLKGKINSKLIGGLKNVRDCMYNCYEFSGINFIGYGLSSSPEVADKKNGFTRKQVGNLKRAIKKIDDKLSKVYKSRKNRKLFTFFISHNIPYNTKLDIINNPKSYVHKKHMGSKIARDFCIKFQPEICVGGHIHECQGKDKIGKTLVVNTGFGPKSTVLVEINVKKKKIKKVEFIK
ncbi:MAG: metallophosphoesterase [Nanoarchaeota archaeon]|nr:metallophosphoesterase [Nanoarchaeota archaeon]